MMAIGRYEYLGLASTAESSLLNRTTPFSQDKDLITTGSGERKREERNERAVA